MLKDIESFPFYRDIVLQVKKDTNEHTVAFVWNGSDVEALWILKGTDGYTSKPLSFIERSFAGVSLKESGGRLEISFTFPIGLHRTLYFVSTPEASRNYAVMFKNDDGKISTLEEVFVMMAEGKCLCRCRVLNGPEFVETMPIDLGPIASFL